MPTQERLDELALEFAKKRAAEAEAAIVQMDVRLALLPWQPPRSLQRLLPACSMVGILRGRPHWSAGSVLMLLSLRILLRASYLPNMHC